MFKNSSFLNILYDKYIYALILVIFSGLEVSIIPNIYNILIR